jgi:hypothetical protein
MAGPAFAHPAPMALWIPAIAGLAALALAGAPPAIGWAGCMLALPVIWRGLGQWRCRRPGLAALASAAALAAAAVGRPDVAAAVLAAGATESAATDPRALRIFSATALGLATAVWLLRGSGPAVAALVAACAATGWLQAAGAAVGVAVARAGVLLSGPDAVRAAAGINGVVVSPLLDTTEPRARVLASRRDRSKALAIAASLLGGSEGTVAAALRAAAARAGLPQAAGDMLRRTGGEVVGVCQGCVAHVGPLEVLARRGLHPCRSLSRLHRRSDGDAYGVAWAGRLRGIVLVGRTGPSADPLRAIGCEVWRRGGKVVPLRRRADEDAFAIADMLARGRRVAVVVPAGGVPPVADLGVQIGGSLPPADAGPAVVLPDPDLGLLAAFLRAARRAWQLRTIAGTAAVLLGGPGIVLAAAGWLGPAAAGWTALAATAACTIRVPVFTSSQRAYA